MTNATPPPTQAETYKLTECIVFLNDEGYGLTAATLVEVRDYIRTLEARVEVLGGEKKRMVDYLRSRSKQIQNGPYDQEARTILSSLSK